MYRYIQINIDTCIHRERERDVWCGVRACVRACVCVCVRSFFYSES